MSRAARALVLTTLLAAACRPGEPTGPAPSPGGLPSREPVVRVGVIVDSATVGVSSSARFTILESSGDVVARGEPGEVFVVRNSGGVLRGQSDRGGQFSGSAQTLRVRAENDTVRLGGRPYRGEALVRIADSGVTAINVLELEAYLLGVVPREIGRRPANEIDAMKAQAVAARTYAVGNMNGRSNLGFDFYATVQDQVYGGASDEDSIVSRAVHETRGEILTHNGRPILAYYSSTCGGRTASIEESWAGRAPLPYLRSVSDRVPGTDQHYCDTSSRFRWQNDWTREELVQVLGETLRAHTRGAVQSVQRVNDVRIVDRNASERVTIDVTADGQTYRVRMDSLRWVLRTEPGGPILNSSMLLELEATTGDDGTVEHLHVEGGGWGHAIGMCQVGAMGRARAGQSYREILAAYYTGARLERLY
ncbi:MAG TPA: SpoIID/LytB domain-containing protein [Longimicrobiales bacterium]|nr:SpoIID/LytB domain-containing protein [Longimicrobiales bacterium]